MRVLLKCQSCSGSDEYFKNAWIVQDVLSSGYWKSLRMYVEKDSLKDKGITGSIAYRNEILRNFSLPAFSS